MYVGWAGLNRLKQGEGRINIQRRSAREDIKELKKE
jgi:hypothetical protein